MNFIAIAVGKCCWSLKVKPCRSQDLMQNSKLWWSYLARRCQLRVEYFCFYGHKQKVQKSPNKKETYFIVIFIFHSWIIHVNGCASAFLDSRIPLLNRWSTSLPRLTNSLWCFLPTALVETKCVGDKTKNAERHMLKHWKQLCCLLIPWWSLWIFGLLMIILHFCGLRIHGLLMHNTFRYSEGKIGTSPEVWDGQVLFRSSFTSFRDNLKMYPFSCMGLLLLRMKPQDTNSYSYPTKPFDQTLDICVYLKSSFWHFQSFE